MRSGCKKRSLHRTRSRSPFSGALGFKMLNRYPDQVGARKGFALIGVLFLCFGVVMLLFHSAIGAAIGFTIGSVLAIPSFVFSHSAFAKFERNLSWLAVFGSF